MLRIAKFRLMHQTGDLDSHLILPKSNGICEVRIDTSNRKKNQMGALWDIFDKIRFDSSKRRTSIRSISNLSHILTKTE